MWQVCRGLFQRADVQGPHVHPHTFRHTVVQMLFLTGSSFEAIAKWIGHSSPQLTSSVYGRLLQRDVEAQLGEVPFLGAGAPGAAADPAAEWQELSRFLRAPYHFTETEGDVGPRRTPPPTPAAGAPPTKQMRRELVERAHRDSLTTARAATSVQDQLQEQLQLLRALQARLDGGAT